jgi:DHA1 family tetracycline resistance protein-like MFS transporter
VIARAPGRHALLFILITIFADTVAFGIIIPVLPKLIAELGDTSISEAASYGGLLMFVFAVMQFLFAPVIGNLSDRFGRRPVLLISLAALGIDYVIMGLAPSLVWLFLGRMVAGVAAATFATANAYVADITPDEQRAARFGLIGAAWGVGFVLGPAIGGLLGEMDMRLPFFAAAGLALANVVYGFVVLPETLARDRRRPFVLKRANPLGAIAGLARYPVIPGLLVAIVLYFIGHDVNPSTWTYYVLHKFQWSEGQIGLALAAVGLSSAVVSGTLVGPIVARLGEARTAYLGFCMAALSCLGYAFASQGWMIFPSIAVGAFMGLVMPSLRSIMSQMVPEDGQGELQGAIASLMGLTAIFAPLIMTQVFRYFSAQEAGVYFPGASFLLAGLLMLLGALVVMAVLRHPSAPPGQPSSETGDV